MECLTNGRYIHLMFQVDTWLSVLHDDTPHHQHNFHIRTAIYHGCVGRASALS